MHPDLVPVVAGAATASGSCASLPVCPPGPGHAGSASLDRQSLLPASAGPFCYGAGKPTAVNGACTRRRLAFVGTRITEDSRKRFSRFSRSRSRQPSPRSGSGSSAGWPRAGSAPPEHLRDHRDQRREGLTAVAEGVLLRRRQLGGGHRQGVGDEDRVVAEAVRAAPLADDPAPPLP